MICKILGGVILLSAATMSARTVMYSEREKIVQLEIFITLISYIRTQIDLYSAPIDKILSGCQKDILNRLGVYTSPKSFAELLSFSDLLVDEESQKILLDFSSLLGKNYRDHELKLCERTIRELEAQKEKLIRIYPSRKKTAMALFLAIGGITVILLL